MWGSRPGLSRITALLTALGEPQRDLRCIHVAGTNGKGSTSMMLAAVLRQAGYRCARFSSPHLHSYRERFMIDGEYCTDEAMYAALQQVKAAAEAVVARGEEHPTEFEVLTAMAFLLFKQAAVQVVVLEAGLGGRDDSTNVVTPLLAVITGIDYDHTAVLGDSLAAIAAHKAGIIKPGAPALIGAMPDEARAVIARRAAALGVELLDAAAVRVTRRGQSLNGQTLNITSGDHPWPEVKLNLNGDFQRSNLALVVKSVEFLRSQGYNITDHDLVNAMATITVPGRMEIACYEPLIILDAAHNPQGARALSQSLGTWLPGSRGLLLCGILDDKDGPGILTPLALRCSGAIITRPASDRAARWQQAAAYWRQHWPAREAVVEEDIAAAVQLALRRLPDYDYLLVCGSFYLLGPVRRMLQRQFSL